MSNFKQWQINEGTSILEGRAASQGVGFEGGKIQKYVPNINDLLEP